jgi:hypothetical protein
MNPGGGRLGDQRIYVQAIPRPVAMMQEDPSESRPLAERPQNKTPPYVAANVYADAARRPRPPDMAPNSLR